MMMPTDGYSTFLALIISPMIRTSLAVDQHSGFEESHHLQTTLLTFGATAPIEALESATTKSAIPYSIAGEKASSVIHT